MPKPTRGRILQHVQGSPILTTLVVTVLALVISFVLKAVCLTPIADRPALRLCYTDIAVFYDNHRIAEGAFPYVEAFNEYPVLTGLFMWALGVPVSSVWSYFVLSAVVLGMLACGASYLLARMRGLRALLWGGAPALVLYAFHNWDLLPAFFVVLGCWFLQNDRPRSAAAALAVSAGFKLYALALLPALALHQFQKGRRREAGQTVLIGFGIFALVNLPIALIDPSGWLTTFTYHSARSPNPDSIWGIGIAGVAELSITQINLVSGVLLLLSVAAALAWAWKSGGSEGTFDFATASGMVIVCLLLWNKVHSLQYALWLLPFFVLVPLKLWWWAAYTVADLAVYGTFFEYGDQLTNGSFPLSTGDAVVIRHVVLLGLLGYMAWEMRRRSATVANAN